MRKLRFTPFVLATVFALVGACNGPLPDALPTTMVQVNSILQDGNISAQSKRTQLANLGLTPAQIDALLVSIRTANQGGGDLRTAYDKVTAGQLNDLTPDEVQLYADAAKTADNTISFTLADKDAQAIVDVLQSNDIASKEQLVAFLDDPVKAASIPAAVPDGSLKGLFVTFDPTLLIDKLP
jgi:hypothetical protein